MPIFLLTFANIAKPKPYAGSKAAQPRFAQTVLKTTWFYYTDVNDLVCGSFFKAKAKRER